MSELRGCDASGSQKLRTDSGASAHPWIWSTLQMDAMLPANYSSGRTAPHPGLQMNGSLQSRVK